MGRHSQRRRRSGADGGNPKQSFSHLVRLERRNRKWRARVLPNPRPHRSHRVRSTAGRSRSHPYDLSRPYKRLWRQAGCSMKARTPRFLIGLAILGFGFARSTEAHRLDEYLQATRISIEFERIGLEMSLTPGAAV